MSALYLIDRHGQPDGTINLSRVLDVQESTTPLMNGRFVVKVPDGIPIDDPSDLGDLISQKAAGYLLVYAGFTRASHDDLLDTSNVDLGASIGIIAGKRAEIVLNPGGLFQSTVVPLTGPSPTQAFITWDTYNFNSTDDATTTFVRQYNELPSVPSNVICQVSFDGINFNPTTDSTILNIPPPVIGTSFIIQLQNATTSRLSIGSWTLIF